MARRYQRGFEINSNAIEFSLNSNVVISNSVYRSGLYSGQITSLASGVAKYVGLTNSSISELYWGFGLLINSIPTQNTTLFKPTTTTSISGTHMGFLRLNTDRTITLHNSSGTQIGNASPAIALDTQAYVEFHKSATVLEARLNGTVFASATGLTLSDTVCAFWGGNLITANDTATGGIYYIDDIVCNDVTGSFCNSWPNTSHIVLLSPNAQGDNNTFETMVGGTAGAANNYTRVSDIPPDDATSYNGTTTLNTIDDYNLSATPSELASDAIVVCVQQFVRARTSATTSPSIKGRIKASSGGTVDVSNETIIPGVSWASYWNTFENDSSYQQPGTSNAWTKATLDTAQIGLTNVNDTNRVFWASATYLLVDYIPADFVSSIGITRSVQWNVSDALNITRDVEWNVSSKVGITRDVEYNVVSHFTELAKQWTFLNNAESFVATSAFAVMNWNSENGNPAGSLDFSVTGNTVTRTGRWDYTGTWESIGIPSGATVRNVRLISIATRVLARNFISSAWFGSIGFMFGTNEVTLWNGRGSNEASGAESGWTVSGPFTTQAVTAGYEPSGSTVDFRVNLSATTGADDTSYVLTAIDQITLGIQYTTPVTLTRTASWNVLSGQLTQVNITRDIEWNVTKYITLVRDIDWNVSDAILLTRNVEWNVTSILAITRETQWNVAKYITITRQNQWNVSTILYTDRDIYFDITKAISTSRQTQWNVSKSISLNRQTQWNVIGITNITRQVSWNVQVIGLTPVTLNRAISWNVYDAIVTNRTINWNVAKYITITRQNLYNINAAILLNKDVEWNLFANLSTNRNIEWHVTTYVTLNRQIRYDISSIVSAITRQLRWNVIGYVNISRIVYWNVLSETSVQLNRQISWNVTGYVTLPRTIQWNVYDAISLNKDIEWQVFTTVAPIVRTVYWNVYTPLSLNRNASWAIYAALLRERSVHWNVNGKSTVARLIRWNVSTIGPTVNRSLQWHIHTSASISRQAIWNVNARTLIPVTLRIREIDRLNFAIREINRISIAITENEMAHFSTFGNDVLIEFEITDNLTDLLIDPASIVMTFVNQRTDTTIIYEYGTDIELEKVSTGTYRLTFIPTEIGTWDYSIVVSGIADGRQESKIVVRQVVPV